MDLCGITLSLLFPWWVIISDKVIPFLWNLSWTFRFLFLGFVGRFNIWRNTLLRLFSEFSHLCECMFVNENMRKCCGIKFYYYYFIKYIIFDYFIPWIFLKMYKIIGISKYFHFFKCMKSVGNFIDFENA